MSSKYLTKSKFQLALSCETKLFYSANKKFKNQNIDNPFMAALAEGGFQVGSLAKCYFPDGIDITSLDHNKAIEETNELLKQENVILFEAAIKFENLFIRADILVKKGNEVKLIEVKAKSFNGTDSSSFLNKSGFLDSGWKSYVYDVAFQKYVLSMAYPQFKLSSYLMLADKNAKTSIEGLNQKFFIGQNSVGRSEVNISSIKSKDELGDEILIKVKLDDILEMVYNGIDSKEPPVRLFEDQVNYLSDYYAHNKKIKTKPGLKCKACEFKCSEEEEQKGFLNGYKTCWKEQYNWIDDDFMKTHIFEIWNYRGKQKLLEDLRYFFTDLNESDFAPEMSSDNGLTIKQRQWLQVEKVLNKDESSFIDIDGLKEEMDQWEYPLHFIDFETSAVAIPFNKNMHSYEGIAFQFSHHTVDKQGNIEHKGEYLNTDKGKFPNFDFIRALKKDLEQDNGTIFRYAPHENSYLNMIYRQLHNSKEPIPDKQELLDWIKTITHSGGDTAETWRGDRDMVDLWKLVKKYYYNPLMKGSNSIKDVLPAILAESKYLQKKYMQPIYGSDTIPSKNFNNWKWIEFDDQQNVINPYKLLPNIFEGVETDQLDHFISDEQLADGGAAMMAYARMQFTQMTDLEKDYISKGLLKYCELDTFAMVLIWEFWNDVIIKTNATIRVLK